MATVNDSESLKLQVQERIQLVGAKLLEQDPMLPVHLSMIHSTLIQHEELVHLLSDQEIATLIKGQIKHTGVQVIKEITGGSKAKAGSKIAKVPKATADDF